MTNDSLLPFDPPAVQRKKVSAAFYGGLIPSDGRLVLLHEAERPLGLAETLAGCIRDRRSRAQVVRSLLAMLHFLMFAIACGYEDTDDCGALRADPLFRLASGQAPESGRALCSQPTMSRLENAPSRIEVARTTAALVDIFCRSFGAPPAANTLDIDDTWDAVPGHQQLSLFHAHYDTRCFLPVHVYHVESGKPVAVLLRPGKTPSTPSHVGTTTATAASVLAASTAAVVPPAAPGAPGTRDAVRASRRNPSAGIWDRRAGERGGSSSAGMLQARDRLRPGARRGRVRRGTRSPS